MARSRIGITASLGCLLLAALPAQDAGKRREAAPPKTPEQARREADRKARQQILLEEKVRLELGARFQVKAPRVVVQQPIWLNIQPVVLPRGRAPLGLEFRQSVRSAENPLIQGGYATALKAFDAARLGLELPDDAAGARAGLDELQLRMIEVRRALWKEERRGAKGIVHLPVSSPAQFVRLDIRPQFVGVLNGGLNGVKLVEAGGKLVADDGSNPFLSGDYRKAVLAIRETRGKLDTESDPKACRRLLDTLNRQLLDLRRALWAIEQDDSGRR